MNSNKVAELTEFLKKDRSSSNPKYPDQAIHALSDERVAKALKARFEDGQTLIAINSLDYSFYLGLIPIYFAFAHLSGLALSGTAVLVLLNGECQVVGLVDPFDLIQPNPLFPPRSIKGELPFVLAQPSATENLTFTEEELSARESRTKEFFQRLAPGLAERKATCRNGWVFTESASTDIVGIRTRVLAGYAVREPVVGIDKDTDD